MANREKGKDGEEVVFRRRPCGCSNFKTAWGGRVEAATLLLPP